MSDETIYPVSRLIYLSLAYSSGKKRIVTQNSAEMTELVQRFQAEDAFRAAVEEGLRALELRLLALEDGGLRLSARNADAFFATTLTDYGRLLARGDLKAADVLPVHCAIAAAFFPTEADLDMPVEDLGAIVMNDVIDILRRFSQVEADLPEQEDRLHPQVRTVARRLRELPEENPDRLRAGAGNSWVDLVSRVLEHLVETGYLLQFEETPGDVEYRPTPAYQTSLREGIVYSFHAFRDILAAHTQAASVDEPEEDEDVSTL
ncbi:MAG: hypothetical protein HKP58_19705 [Desulfatitalea sp.]|nr:hypothetical protein [Desulfatitalea sp.]NNK02643.1 hypothetical protein [Desulfatitalea sp.]